MFKKLLLELFHFFIPVWFLFSFISDYDKEHKTKWRSNQLEKCKPGKKQTTQYTFPPLVNPKWEIFTLHVSRFSLKVLIIFSDAIGYYLSPMHITCYSILVFTKRCIWYIRSSDVPNMDIKIHQKRATEQKQLDVQNNKTMKRIKWTLPRGFIHWLLLATSLSCAALHVFKQKHVK